MPLTSVSGKNEKGEKIIPFENYFMEQELMDEIVEKHLKGKRLSKLTKQAIRNTVYSLAPKSS